MEQKKNKKSKKQFTSMRNNASANNKLILLQLYYQEMYISGVPAIVDHNNPYNISFAL